MTGYATLTLAVDPRGIATLTLQRPEKHNAMSAAMLDDLTRAATALADPTIRLVVLTGAGESFCAGGDLGWMRAQFAADRATRTEEARRLAGVFQALNTLPKPLIGRINGAAYGGGIGLICVCDVAIAVQGVRFGLTETRLGLIPATISPYVIARMGEGAARRVFFSARLFGAEEAVTLGLIARAVPDDALDAAVAAEVEPYLAAAPGAVAAAKRLARSLGPTIDAAVIARSIEALADTWDGAEAQAGVAAFLDRTTPPWRV